MLASSSRKLKSNSPPCGNPQFSLFGNRSNHTRFAIRRGQQRAGPPRARRSRAGESLPGSRGVVWVDRFEILHDVVERGADALVTPLSRAGRRRAWPADVGALPSAHVGRGDDDVPGRDRRGGARACSRQQGRGSLPADHLFQEEASPYGRLGAVLQPARGRRCSHSDPSVGGGGGSLNGLLIGLGNFHTRRRRST